MSVQFKLSCILYTFEDTPCYGDRNRVTDAKLVQTKFKLNDKKFCLFYSLFDDRVFGQSIIYLPLYKISFNSSNAP